MNYRSDERFNIIIADDHPCVRDGLVNMLAENPHFFVSEIVGSGKDLKRAVELGRPHLVITDLRMPEGGGLEIGKQLKALNPDLYVIAYTGFSKEHYMLRMLLAGFDGIVLKTAGKEEVLTAITMVLGGYEGYCNNASRKVNQLIQRNLYNPRRNTVKLLMNERYVSILKFIALGLSSEEIAAKLGLGVQTIHTYRKRLLVKTGCTNPPNLVHYAFMNGIIDEED